MSHKIQWLQKCINKERIKVILTCTSFYEKIRMSCNIEDLWVYFKSQCLVYILYFHHEKYLTWFSESFSCGPAHRDLIGEYVNVCMGIFISIFLEANHMRAVI